MDPLLREAAGMPPVFYHLVPSIAALPTKKKKKRDRFHSQDQEPEMFKRGLVPIGVVPSVLAHCAFVIVSLKVFIWQPFSDFIRGKCARVVLSDHVSNMYVESIYYLNQRTL